MITSYHVIGASYTPVRAVIERAAEFIDRPVACISLVVTQEGIAGISLDRLRDMADCCDAVSSEAYCLG